MSDNKPADNESETKKSKLFAFKPLFVALLLLVAVLWTMAVLSGYFDKPFPDADQGHAGKVQAPHSQSGGNGLPAKTGTSEISLPVAPVADKPGQTGERLQAAVQGEEASSSSQLHPADKKDAQANAKNEAAIAKGTPNEPAGHKAVPKDESSLHMVVSKSGPEAGDHQNGQTGKAKPVGVAFVEATIKPLYHELKERFWGWRPNDILDFTDNANNFQLGVLEVTRRTAVVLSERISRTGTNDVLDPNLENAMNWFMIKADRYWFPSAESKYKEGLRELARYKQKLLEGRASFYVRTDNLIPLLSSYEDLLGSCDKNLVKAYEEDGSPVSYFKADDYVYYSRGVASAMMTILEAVQHDFSSILESRHGTELLHHAIKSCQRAAAIDPILVINSKLDGIFANHRANMAAPISHARFYLGQLIKTLST